MDQVIKHVTEQPKASTGHDDHHTPPNAHTAAGLRCPTHRYPSLQPSQMVCRAIFHDHHSGEQPRSHLTDRHYHPLLMRRHRRLRPRPLDLVPQPTLAPLHPHPPLHQRSSLRTSLISSFSLLDACTPSSSLPRLNDPSPLAGVSLSQRSDVHGVLTSGSE